MRTETLVEPRVESLARVRTFVEEACRQAGADSAACFDLKLAVDEALTNIIEHGYAGRPGEAVSIACEFNGEAVRVTIVDRGRPFAPSTLAPADTASDWRERPLGGLGWHLIRRSVDEIDYVSDPVAGNRLTLTKRSQGRWTSE